MSWSSEGWWVSGAPVQAERGLFSLPSSQFPACWHPTPGTASGPSSLCPSQAFPRAAAGWILIHSPRPWFCQRPLLCRALRGVNQAHLHAARCCGQRPLGKEQPRGLPLRRRCWTRAFSELRALLSINLHLSLLGETCPSRAVPGGSGPAGPGEGPVGVGQRLGGAWEGT